MNNRVRNVIALTIALLLCYGAAAVGGIAGAGGGGGWYADLTKPSWTPPSWVFGPVWTVLYTMMAVSAWMVWLQRSRLPVATPLGVFTVHLVFNAAWSPLFFGLQCPGIAFVDIILLWLSLVMTILLFIKRQTLAGLLLVPYLLWVSFATVLNFMIWHMNM